MDAALPHRECLLDGGSGSSSWLLDVRSAGQALVLANYLVGPSYGVAMILLVAFRVAPEERMMLEEFGDEYEEYRGRTQRLVPGLW